MGRHQIRTMRGRRHKSERAAAAVLAMSMAMAVSSACGPTSDPTTTAHRVAASKGAPTPVAAPVQVVGLGDSVTAGTACGCQDFIELYAAGLARRWHQAVRETNLGRPGLTGSGLLARLRDDPTYRARVAAADVVIVTIGANDLLPALRAWDEGSRPDEQACGGICDTRGLDPAGRDVAGVLAEVGTLRGGRPTLVLVTTYWNVFEDGDVAATDRGPTTSAGATV